MLSLDFYSIALDSGTNSNFAKYIRFFFHCCVKKNTINQLKIQFKVYSTAKIQQTKMLVTCQRFGDVFLFGLVWQ